MKKLVSLILISLGLLTQSNPDERILRVHIGGMIDLGLAPFVRRVIADAGKDGAEAIVFEINTLGGGLDPMIQIRDAILDSRVRTIAFINKRAISAGALIALACQEIYMTPGASIGAATPVYFSGEKASEKVVSYSRAEFKTTAEKNGRPASIAEAMVDESIEIPGLIEKGRLLTLTTEDAISWKVADGKVDDFTSLLEKIGLSGASVTEAKINWAENLVRFVNHPLISMLLLAIGIFGLLAEVMSPGWGVPGTAGIIALSIYFGSHYVVGLAGWEELLLLGVGLILLALEVFVIPGFGITGILGIIAVTAGLLLSLLGRFPSTQAISHAVLIIFASLVLSIIGAFLLFKIVRRRPVWSKISLPTQETKQGGFISSDARSDLVGKEGIALTDLRPTGTGLFDHERLDVISEGDYIPVHSKIKIIKHEGYRLIVRAIEE